MAAPADYRPTVDAVGAIMRARTVDQDGDELGTFTEDTRPTAAEAEGVLDQALALVGARLGSVPDAFATLALSLVALRAAMLIETGYFSQEADPDSSAYAAYREQYRDALADYDEASKANVGPTGYRVASVATPTVLSSQPAA